MSPPIRVMIVDDHAIVREGLRTLLGDEPDIDIVGEAGNGEEALASAADLAPDVILMDLILPGIDGIEATKRLRGGEAHPGAPRVIVLTSTFGDDMRVREAIRAGATGYLLKDVMKADLLYAVKQAALGRPALHPEAQAQLMQEAAPPPPHDTLTGRELDVLRLIGRGMSNKRIAATLDLSEGTVKGYVSLVLSKLDVKDRTQAALYAASHGLVPDEG